MVSRFAWETIGRVGAWMISSHVSTAHSHHSPGKEGLDRMSVFETRSDSLCVDWMVVNLSGYGECSQVVASGELDNCRWSFGLDMGCLWKRVVGCLGREADWSALTWRV